MDIVINSKSSGKYRTDVINNRPHLITEMVSIVGDTVMNGLFYPLPAVQESFSQLHELAAPAGHPVVAGQNASASHPLAMNAHNFGGMVQNPRMVGNQVINELAIDLEVANKDERGKQIVERIENGESIGVSTGLNGTVVKTPGKSGDRSYSGVISNIQFDHVAVLLEEPPAGEHTYTINSAEKDILIYNLADSVNDLRESVSVAANEKFGGSDRCVWVADILIAESKAIIEVGEKYISAPFGYDDDEKIVFTGDGVEVKRHVSFKPVGSSASNLINRGDKKMDKDTLVLAIIANSANRYTQADKDSLTAMSEIDLVNAMHKAVIAPEQTVEQAQAVIEKAGLTVNSADFDKEAFADFVTNQADFSQFKAAKDSAKSEKVAVIVKNSKMVEEDVLKMSDSGIENLFNSLTPAFDYSAQGQPINNNDRGESSGKIELHEGA